MPYGRRLTLRFDIRIESTIREPTCSKNMQWQGLLDKQLGNCRKNRQWLLEYPKLTSENRLSFRPS